MEFIMQISDNIYEALVVKELKHEARVSDRQVRMAEWHQFEGRTFRVSRYREVILSDELANAIASLPVDGRKVFKNRKYSSLLVEMPKCPDRSSTPVSEDLEGKLAKLIAEKLLS